MLHRAKQKIDIRANRINNSKALGCTIVITYIFYFMLVQSRLHTTQKDREQTVDTCQKPAYFLGHDHFSNVEQYVNRC